jgi:hypothetical protein
MLYQGTWEILCGVAIFLFGDSFWAPPESYQTKEVAREGLIDERRIAETLDP